MTFVPPYPGSGWSGDEGPGRKIWGGTGAPPPAPDCSTAVSLMELTGDSGSAGPAATPISFAGGAPPSHPSVIVGCMGMARHDTFDGSDPVLSAPWTTLGTFAPAFPGAHNMFVSGYEAVASGSPDPFVVGWTPIAANYYGVLHANIPTSSTAPVQSATNTNEAAQSVTLGSPPTPGNLLVLQRLAATPDGNPAPAPAGWTEIGTIAMATPVAQSETLGIYARCAVNGDSATVAVAFGHAQFFTVSEWAITSGGGGGGGATVTVNTIPALLAALADNGNAVIVVTDGTYVVDQAFAQTASSLYIGAAFAGRTLPVIVHPTTPGGVTFTRSGGAGGAIAFVEGAHHQTWDGFKFANMTIDHTGVVFWGGVAGANAPHDISLLNCSVLASCHRVNAGTVDHAMYFSYALDTWANIIVRNWSADLSDALGLATGIHMDHGGPGDAPNVAAHGVTIDGFTITGNGTFNGQQCLIIWQPPIHDWTIQNGTITNAGDTAVRFESIGAAAVAMNNIASTGSVNAGFFSSLGTYPTVPGVTFSGCTFA